MKKIGPLEIFSLLPQTNCKKCGEETCMAFAAKLAEYKIEWKQCTPLLEEAKYAEKKTKLVEMMRPPIREVTIGVGENAVRIGGKLVLYRHELHYNNPTPIFVDVEDTMPADEIARRVDFTKNMNYLYIGRSIHLDGIAVRSVSNDPKQFAKTISTITSGSQLPLLLCSHTPAVIEAGLDVAGALRPLICSATKDNWKEMAGLAKKHDCPLTVAAPNDLAGIRSLAATLGQAGLDQLVLDPGLALGDGFGTSIENYVMMRKAAVRKDDAILGYPTLGATMPVWKQFENPDIALWNEAILASVLITRFVDILVTHSTEIWTYLPLMIWRENIYTDPMKPVSVKPGLMPIGAPNENSPLLVTTNFALTYFTVQGDLTGAQTNCHLLALNTEGLSVGSALAGRKMTAQTVADALQEYQADQKVKHKTMIIPGLAARLQGEIEDLTGWRVRVGPPDSSGITQFLQTSWGSNGPIEK